MSAKKRGLEFPEDADERTRVAENQRALCIDLATRLEGSAPLVLTQFERDWIAGALRFCAQHIVGGKPKGKRGSAPKFDASSEAMIYAAARAAGRPHGEVVDEIADRVGVSRNAVEKGIAKRRAAAFALIQKADPGNNQ